MRTVETKLNAKQLVFVEAYLRTFQKTTAAKEAGYYGTTQEATRLLALPKVQEYIAKRMSELAMQADEALYRLAEQARMSIADFIMEDPNSPDGFTLNWETIRARGHLIKSIRSGRSGPVIELHDGQKALELIGRNLGLFVDKVQVDENQSGEITVRFIPSGHQDQMVSPTEAGRTLESGGSDGDTGRIED